MAVDFQKIDRYHKDNIEPFARSVIAASYNRSYADYIKPLSTDDFDFLSANGKVALEISMILPPETEKAYTYEKAIKKKGNSAVWGPDFNMASFDDNNRLVWYYQETRPIIAMIKDRIKAKNATARKRLQKRPYQTVELCLCIDDGGWLDLRSFQIDLSDIDTGVFARIFFITSSYFIVYDRDNGYKELERKLH